MGDDVRELIQQTMDIREQLARLDTKLDRLEDVKMTADAANERSRDALALAQENARDIAEIKADDRRKWGAIGGMAASFIVSVLVYLLTK